MSGGAPRFDPSEIDSGNPGDRSIVERADLLAAARELEALAGIDGIRPTEGFDDRVMRAIAAQPAPRAMAGAGARPAWFGVPLALRNAWAVAGTSGRPLAVRAQALAFVLLVCLVAGSLVTAAGALTVGGLLGQHPDATPSTAPAPTAPASTPTPSPSQTPEPTPTPGIEESPSPGTTTDPGETTRPTATLTGAQTPRPTETPEPTDTPQPTDSHGSDESGGGSPGPG